MAAALTLLGTVIPLIVALIGTLRFPTLRRRVRDHAALLAELPGDVGEPLKELLSAEVEQLVKRDQRRLNARVRRFLTSARVLASAAAVLASLVAVGGLAALYRTAPLAEPILLVVSALAATAVVSGSASAVASFKAQAIARTETDPNSVEELVRRLHEEDGPRPAG